MKNKKKGAILVYILILMTLSTTFAVILLSNNSFLFNINEEFSIRSQLQSNILSDSKILIDINKSLNANGSGFIDNIACPQNFTMSGSSLKNENINTSWVYSGTLNELFYCNGSFNGNDINIFLNSSFSDFIKANYNGFVLNSIHSGSLSNTFSDSESTLLDFEDKNNYYFSDDIDDNFDSDNYKVTSSGSTATGTYYSGSFEDDDVVGRKSINGYVPAESGFKKIFWNSPKYLDIINSNINNNDILNIKIGEVNGGYLYIDVDNNFDLSVVEFDKSIYSSTKELVIKDKFIGTNVTGSGYINKTSGLDTIFDNSTTKSFNFQDNMYSIFIKNNSTDTLFYNIIGEEKTTGSGIYLTPIDDSDDMVIKFLGNEIIINDKGYYSSQELELIYER